MSIRIVQNNSNHLRVVSDPAPSYQITNTVPTAQLIQTKTEAYELARVLGPPPRGLEDLGWRFFSDSRYTDQNPLYIMAGVKTQIPDDGKGMLQTSYGVNSLNWLRPDTGRLYPDHIGDFYLYRLNFTVTPIINNKSMLISFDIGTPNPVYNERETLNGGAGLPVPVSKLISSGAGPAMVVNGVGIFVMSEADCMISRISILAVKTYAVDRGQ